MSEFTKGEWTAKRNGNSCVVVSTESNGLIYGLTDAEQNAYGGYLICESVSPCNLDILAAAPELYEALTELSNIAIQSVEIDDWPELQKALDLAHDALWKAKGEA